MYVCTLRKGSGVMREREREREREKIRRFYYSYYCLVASSGNRWYVLPERAIAVG